MLLAAALLRGVPSHAAKIFIWVSTPEGRVQIRAEEIEKTIWVDLVQTAQAFKHVSFVRRKTCQVVLASRTSIVNLDNSTWYMTGEKVKKMRPVKLPDPVRITHHRVMVSLRSLPVVLDRNLTYHLQRKTLEDQLDTDSANKNTRSIAVRNLRFNKKTWISLEDLARALGVVTYSSQSGGHNLVLPDFSILELRSGQTWVYKKQQRYVNLEDPLLLFSGVPYITLGSIPNIFGIEVAWERSRQTLRIPVIYGRLADIHVPPAPLRVIGYQPERLNFTVEELSVFAQDPGPTYPARHDELYESVRDFFTMKPLDPGTSGYDQVSGNLLAGLKGSFLRAPFSGQGEFEKIGTRGRVVSGSLRWGFPWFQVVGGREYMKLGGLYRQFDPVDQVAISHSNDAYGEGRANPEVEVRSSYGHQRFFVFISTDLFSQTVNFSQEVISGALDFTAEISPRQQVGFGLEQYHFTNHARGFSQSFIYLDLTEFGLPPEDPIIIPVTPEDAEALSSTVLSDRHATTLVDLNYQWTNVLQLTGASGFSYFQDKSPERRWVVDRDWRAVAVLGSSRNKLDISYEDVGPRYRSIGDPLRYQARKITRFTPAFTLFQRWRMYGEFRREDSAILVPQGGKPYRSDYAYLTNSMNWSRGLVRLGASRFDSDLYGLVWQGNLDHSYYLGRHSLDVGAGWGSQWDSTDALYRQSYTGRAGFQIVKQNARFSLSQEMTRIHYRRIQNNKWESDSKALFNWGSYRALAQYHFEPKFSLDEDTLHTGYIRLGRKIGEKKALHLFYAVASVDRELSHPEVWRAGIEYSNDF